jgi:FkbH-like protein
MSSKKVSQIKCIIWDLDGTIWNGWLYHADEPVLKPKIVDILNKLDERGIISCIASTNDYEYAKQYLIRMEIFDLFVLTEINMNKKIDSINRISNLLSMRMENIAFIDDDHLELGMAKSVYPDITVLSAEQYLDIINMPMFIPSIITTESRNRRKMLKAETKRHDELTKYKSLEDFLLSCDIKFSGRIAISSDVDRLYEMAIRTNKMNITGEIFTKEMLLSKINSIDYDVIVGSLSDKFGDYGIVVAAILKKTDKNIINVDAMWISCRVSKRGLPKTFFSFLAIYVSRLGISKINIKYIPNKVNRLAAFHLGQYGFKVTEICSNGSIFYNLILPKDIRPFPKWVCIDD